MTTWEIKQKIEENNYCITGKLYLEIISTSYQILQVKHELLGNKYHLTTSDGYDVRFQVNWNK